MQENRRKNPSIDSNRLTNIEYSPTMASVTPNGNYYNLLKGVKTMKKILTTIFRNRRDGVCVQCGCSCN